MDLGSGFGSDPIPYRLVAAAALVVAFLIPAGSLDNGPILCPFRLLTGLPCPTCGLTRAWVAAMHGDFGTSVALHPLGLLVVAGAVVLALSLDRRIPQIGRLVRHRSLYAAPVAGWFAVWLVRVATWG